MAYQAAMMRNSRQLYRDCMRTIEHMAGRNSQRCRQAKLVVREEFMKNKDVSDPKSLEELKANAIKGLSNYLTVTSLGGLYRDPRRKNGEKLFEIISSHEAKEGDDVVEMFKDPALTNNQEDWQPKHLNQSFGRSTQGESERRRLRREKRQETVNNPPHKWAADEF